MTEDQLARPGVAPPGVEEAPPGPDRDHPPFRLRERRLLLLPDLRPPSLEELRWAARERRRRRDAPAPEQRGPVSHERLAPREPADVPSRTVVAEASSHDVDQRVIELPEAAAPRVEVVGSDPDALVEPESEPAPRPQADSERHAEPEPYADSVFERQPEAAPDASEELADPELDPDFLDLHDPEFPDLRPWRPLVLADPEPLDATEPSWVRDVRTEASVVVLEPAPDVAASDVPEDPQPTVEPGPGEPRDDDAGPRVSHVLVVREPASASGRIAVLDDPVADDFASDEVALGGELEVLAEAPTDVAVEIDARPAPLYWRLLRLRYTKPNGWLRALFFEGAVATGVVLVLAEVATVWTIVVLPLIVAVVVKANDVLAGSLRSTYRQPKRRTES